MNTKSLAKHQQGQMLILAIVVVGLVLVNTLILIGGSTLYFQNTTYSLQTNQATNLAEAGVDKAVASLNVTAGAYNGESETVLGNGSFEIVVTSPDASTKVIESTGYIPNKTNPKSKRTIKITASKGEGISFNYGVQAGNGGVQMDNSNVINGSIYSNGSITASNSNQITGDVWIAGGTQAVPNQQTDCTDVNCADYLFGKSISGQNRLDVAQSFQATTSAVLNKVALKLKKFGNPPNVTVRILGNSGSNPNKNNVLATGTLTASLVTTSYGWVDVTFSSSPSLTSGTTYWIMIDTSSDTNNYWSWQNDTIQSYTLGQPKWSANWSAGSPTWTAIIGDLAFKAYMGGVLTQLDGGNAMTVNGDVHANTINRVTISGDAYYQTISNSTVSGTSYPGSADPPPQNMPISDANITDWKEQAESSGILSTPDCNQATVWGPGKYTGNVSFGNSCKEKVKTPIWVTGNVTFTNSVELKLDPSFGSTSGVILSDGLISFGNSNKLYGSGTAGSFLMTLTTYDSRTNGVIAIDVNNSIDSGILYAGDGLIDVKNGNAFEEMTGWKIILKNGIQLNYQSGLASLFFTSGPGGSYSIVKGTYQLR